MNWREKALNLLNDSLIPVPSELNDLDWKAGVSDKSDRLAQHISAFANHPGGGVLVFGVNNDGSHFSLNGSAIEDIIKKLGNIAHNNLANPIQIEHAVMDYEGSTLLFENLLSLPGTNIKNVSKTSTDSYSSMHGN